MFKVKYEDNSGCSDGINEYETEEAAEKAIEEELDNVKDWFDQTYKDYDYVNFGTKTEIWVPGGNWYASWDRLWKYDN